MDYDEVNNCMTEQQKNSLKTAALQQLLQQVLGAPQEYTSYDDVNNQLTEQQKNSYQTAALQQLVEAGIGGGKQYTLILDTTLSDVEEILPLSSDIDGSDTSAKLIGISVSDFLQYLEDVTTGGRTDLPNLKVHVYDAGSGMDAFTVGDVSIVYRYTGEDDPETGDPIFHYYLSFAAYSSTDEIYKYYQGEIKLDDDEWCIGLKEVPFGYPNIDDEEF